MSKLPTKFTLTDERYQRGLVSHGEPESLARFCRKCRSGQPIVYGAIGGSITAGASAEPGKAYAPLLADWLGEQMQVQFINAGIGASNSLFGSFRAQKDLLGHMPDLITVEYAVNDVNNPNIELSYEALLRQCLMLPNKPLVVLIFTMNRSGENVQNIHIPIGQHYGLPMLSYRDALYPEITAGNLTWEDTSPDEVHPNDAGHAFIFEMLRRYLNIKLNDVEQAQETEKVLPRWLDPQAQRYVGQLVDASQMQVIHCNGWEQGPHKGGYIGWQTKIPGAELVISFTGTLAYIGYQKYAGDFGKVAATLDGKPLGELDGFYEKPLIQQWAGGHTVLEKIATDLAPGPHTLALELLKDNHPDSHGHDFDFGYLLLS